MNNLSFKGRHKKVSKITLEGDYFLDEGAILKLKQPIIEDETQPDGTIQSHLVFNLFLIITRSKSGSGLQKVECLPG